MYEIHGKSIYKPKTNRFGTENNIGILWEYCRDSVLEEGKKKRLFYSTKHKERVINFINLFQEDIGLTEQQKLIIEETNVENVLCLHLSKFWRKRMRRSLLTALLRAFNARKKYDKALEKSRYFKHSQPALNRFMDGHFKFKKEVFCGFKEDFDGWCAEFNRLSKREVKEKLI